MPGGNACLGKFFFLSPLCFRPENREEIQTTITPVPLPEKCPPPPPVPSRYPPRSEGKVTRRQLDELDELGAGGGWLYPPTYGQGRFGTLTSTFDFI